MHKASDLNVNFFFFFIARTFHITESKHRIQERADTEWKFARSKLWISYFEEGNIEMFLTFLHLNF